jgi:hypothetical protein
VPCTDWCAGGSSACPTRVCPISLSIPGLKVTSVGEERRFNPRLGGEIGEADFTGYMKNLRLAHPKKMDVAVPANLKCGRPETDPDVAEDPNWAPLKFTLTGIWEIDPHGLEEHAPAVQNLDVRQPGEFDGRSDTSATRSCSRSASWSSARASSRATVRHRGVPRRRRSAQATVILREVGFADAANLPAGCCAGAPRAMPSKAAGAKPSASSGSPKFVLLSVYRFRCYPLPPTLIVRRKFVDPR